MRNPIKRLTATQFSKRNAVYHLLDLLERYKSVVVTHHGEDKLVIHKPDAPVTGIEREDDETL